MPIWISAWQTATSLIYFWDWNSVWKNWCFTHTVVHFHSHSRYWARHHCNTNSVSHSWYWKFHRVSQSASGHMSWYVGISLWDVLKLSKPWDDLGVLHGSWLNCTFKSHWLLFFIWFEVITNSLSHPPSLYICSPLYLEVVTNEYNTEGQVTITVEDCRVSGVTFFWSSTEKKDKNKPAWSWWNSLLKVRYSHSYM